MNKYIIKPPDHEFTDIPAKILGDPGIMPHIKVIISTLIIIYIYLNIHTLDVMYTLSNIYFQDWIRAIDALEDQKPYIGRKGIPTLNIMGACNFNMQFISALAGSEDTTHDARIFVTTIHYSQMNFPQHPKGNIIQ